MKSRVGLLLTHIWSSEYPHFYPIFGVQYCPHSPHNPYLLFPAFNIQLMKVAYRDLTSPLKNFMNFRHVFFLQTEPSNFFLRWMVLVVYQCTILGSNHIIECCEAQARVWQGKARADWFKNIFCLRASKWDRIQPEIQICLHKDSSCLLVILGWL